MRVSFVIWLLALCASCGGSPFVYSPAHATSQSSTASFLHDLDVPDLASVELPPGAAEIRVWRRPSFKPPQGLVLRMQSGRSGAAIIDKSGMHETTLSVPIERTWKKLEAQGIFTLPNQSTLPEDHVYIVDGVSFVFQVRRGGEFREYTYDNPYDHTWPESETVLRMLHTLSSAFGVMMEREDTSVRDPIADKQVVFVRKGQSVGAFFFTRQRWDHRANRARYTWAFRDGGSGPLRGDDVDTGSDEIVRLSRSNAFVRFGPFSIEWQVQTRCTGTSDGPNYVGDMHADHETRFCQFGMLRYPRTGDVAIAVTTEESIETADPDDPSLVYRTARIAWDD